MDILVLLGSFAGFFEHASVYTAVAATGATVVVLYLPWMFQRVNFGPVTNAKNRGQRDLSVRECIVIAPICPLSLLMGAAPGIFLTPLVHPPR